MRFNPKQLLAWAIPAILISGTVVFFLVLIKSPTGSASSATGKILTAVGVMLIILCPAGTLLYHRAARREDDAVERDGT